MAKVSAFQSQLETYKSNLVKDIEPLLTAMTASDLQFVSTTLNAILPSKIVEAVRELGEFCFSSFSSLPDSNRILSKRRHYLVNFGPHVEMVGTLIIGFLPVDPSSANLSKGQVYFEVPLPNHGYYKSAVFSIHHSLAHKRDRIVHITSEVVHLINRLFEKKYFEVLERQQSDLADQLYTYARSTISSENVRRDVWFAGISNGNGFRIWDKRIVQKTIEDIGETALLHGRSAAEVTSEILNVKMPIDDMVMRHVIGENMSIDVDVSDSKYGRDKSSYFDAMQILYRGTSATVHPVLVEPENDFKILILSSTKNKRVIEEFIDSHRNALRSIAEEQKGRFLPTIEKISPKPSADLLRLISENLGSFAGGFITSIR